MTLTYQVLEAIKSLAERKGSSIKQIADFIERDGESSKNHGRIVPQIKRTLQRAEDDGLVCSYGNGLYRLTDSDRPIGRSSCLFGWVFKKKKDTRSAEKCRLQKKEKEKPKPKDKKEVEKCKLKQEKKVTGKRKICRKRRRKPRRKRKTKRDICKMVEEIIEKYEKRNINKSKGRRPRLGVKSLTRRRKCRYVSRKRKPSSRRKNAGKCRLKKSRSSKRKNSQSPCHLTKNRSLSRSKTRKPKMVKSGKCVRILITSGEKSKSGRERSTTRKSRPSEKRKSGRNNTSSISRKNVRGSIHVHLRT
ncbi:hypothetical protein L9F63_009639 [Diploptera punctata]|uniref:H15 domain-containing protein n=1 Tax=Diploptera punctata TaxID=6984 RepID=A0AAD8ER14_DIPPU|nr:hypothetical protein L9F63_009639 [Diploptera punctata]